MVVLGDGKAGELVQGADVAGVLKYVYLLVQGAGVRGASVKVLG